VNHCVGCAFTDPRDVSGSLWFIGGMQKLALVRGNQYEQAVQTDVWRLDKAAMLGQNPDRVQDPQEAKVVRESRHHSLDKSAWRVVPPESYWRHPTKAKPHTGGMGACANIAFEGVIYCVFSSAGTHAHDVPRGFALHFNYLQPGDAAADGQPAGVQFELREFELSDDLNKNGVSHTAIIVDAGRALLLIIPGRETLVSIHEELQVYNLRTKEWSVHSENLQSKWRLPPFEGRTIYQLERHPRFVLLAGGQNLETGVTGRQVYVIDLADPEYPWTRLTEHEMPLTHMMGGMSEMPDGSLALLSGGHTGGPTSTSDCFVFSPKVSAAATGWDEAEEKVDDDAPDATERAWAYLLARARANSLVNPEVTAVPKSRRGAYGDVDATQLLHVPAHESRVLLALYAGYDVTLGVLEWMAEEENGRPTVVHGMSLLRFDNMRVPDVIKRRVNPYLFDKFQGYDQLRYPLDIVYEHDGVLKYITCRPRNMDGTRYCALDLI